MTASPPSNARPVAGDGTELKLTSSKAPESSPSGPEVHLKMPSPIAPEVSALSLTVTCGLAGTEPPEIQILRESVELMAEASSV